MRHVHYEATLRMSPGLSRVLNLLTADLRNYLPVFQKQRLVDKSRIGNAGHTQLLGNKIK